jgi:hypothetical protein
MIRFRGHEKLEGSGIHLLKNNRADITRGRMATVAIVPDIDELDDGLTGLSA